MNNTKMDIQEQIKNYIDSQPDKKRSDIEILHKCMLKIFPDGNNGNIDKKIQ